MKKATDAPVDSAEGISSEEKNQPVEAAPSSEAQATEQTAATDPESDYSLDDDMTVDEI